MTQRQRDEYTTKAAIDAISFLGTALLHEHLRVSFPNVDAYEAGNELVQKRQNEFLTSAAQAFVAAVI